MADAALAEKPEIDNPEDDVRSAIEELKLQSEPEARVVIDKSSAERARDAEGKFIEAPKDRKVLTLSPKDAGINVAAQPQLGVVEPPAPVAIKAPEGWKAELKAKFNELPPEVQAEISRREGETHKALTKQDDERLFGKRVSEIVSPYLPTIRSEGGTPEKAIETLLQTAHVLRQGTDQQKAMAVAQVIQQFKVSPQGLFSILQGGNAQGGQPLQQGQFDPRLETLQQRVDRMERAEQEAAQQRQLQEDARIQGLLADFAAKPGHEHYEQVKVFMGHLLSNDQAVDLDEAYNKAIWANPEIRSSLIAAQVDPNKRLTEQTAKTERARNAAVSVTGSPGGARALNGAANPHSSIEDDLRAAIRERDGRV